LNQKVLDSK